MKRIDNFYKSRKPAWEQLVVLLEQSEKNIQRLTPQQIQTLGQLYRAAASDLALAQRDFPTHPVTQYLNQLVARTHAQIYREQPFTSKRLIHFVTAGFPRCYRESWRFILAASLIMVLAAIFSTIAVYQRPEMARWLLPAGSDRLIQYIENHQLWTDEIEASDQAYVSASVMTNNIQVAFLAYGGGILAGIPTVWAMFLNGMMVGSITGLTLRYGLAFQIWTFMIGHGVIELSVIGIAGGSGLMLGWGVVHPGLLRRRDAIVLAAHKVIRLLVGSAMLLVIAGLIEGFISPSQVIPAWVKWGVGLTTGIGLYSYLLLAGRKSDLAEK